MQEGTTIQVNFGKPMPIFPLNSVVLMPHGVHAFHIFEDRYRQMIDDVLDSSGQIAMAVFEGDRWKQEYHGRPPIRPAVCVAQIVQHHRLPDGRYNIALHGVCRARIVKELPPTEGKLYREAMLEPLDRGEEDEAVLSPHRERIAQMLEDEPLTDLRDSDRVVEHIRDTEIPAATILELVTYSFLTDSELRYRLLATGNAEQRAVIIEDAIDNLADLLRKAQPQREVDCPKGCSWN